MGLCEIRKLLCDTTMVPFPPENVSDGAGANSGTCGIHNLAEWLPSVGK